MIGVTWMQIPAYPAWDLHPRDGELEYLSASEHCVIGMLDVLLWSREQLGAGEECEATSEILRIPLC